MCSTSAPLSRNRSDVRMNLPKMLGGEEIGGWSAMKVLGVDTSLRSSGLALIEVSGCRIAALAHGLVRNPPDRPLSQCLATLHSAVGDWIARQLPDVAAIEGVFYCRNVRTAVVLGEARGVVIAACASSGVPVYEYAPLRVKQSVVGAGTAGKAQVQRMVAAILGIREPLHEDESDAFAVAICHAHSVPLPSDSRGKSI